MEHQDTRLTSMRPRLKELNDNPYINHTGVFRNGKMNYIFLSVIRIIPLEDSEKVTTFAPKYVQLKK